MGMEICTSFNSRLVDLSSNSKLTVVESPLGVGQHDTINYY